MVRPVFPADTGSAQPKEDKMRNRPKRAAVYGVDLGKTRFDVVGMDASGTVLERLKFRRETLLAFFAAAPAGIVGMEACPGSQWLARQLKAFGHTVRIIPAQFVKPYVKSVLEPTSSAFSSASRGRGAGGCNSAREGSRHAALSLRDAIHDDRRRNEYAGRGNDEHRPKTGCGQVCRSFRTHRHLRNELPYNHASIAPLRPASLLVAALPAL
jgi:hypothetical protein